MKKKWFSVVAILCVASQMLLGCNDSQGSSSTESDVASAQSNVESSETSQAANDGSFYSQEPITFTFLYKDNASWPYNDEWLIFDVIKEKTNVTLDAVVVPSADYGQKRDILLSSGEAPDYIAETSYTDIEKFIDSGVIVPVSDYMQLLPNFQERVEKWNLQESVDNIRWSDDKFYALPALLECNRDIYTIGIRMDIFEENNLAIPTTYDELYSVCKQLKELYPDITPWSDTWQMNATLQTMAPAFGTRGGWAKGNLVMYDYDKDSWTFFPTIDGHKDMLTYLNKLCSEGLLDPDSFIRESQEAVALLANGKTFIQASGSTDLAGTNETGKQMVGENFHFTKILPPSATYDYSVPSNQLWSGYIIPSTSLENPHFNEMLQFLDWLNYSDEGLITGTYGKEGVTYEIVDGSPVFTSDIKYGLMNPNGTLDPRVEYGLINRSIISSESRADLINRYTEEDGEYLLALEETDPYLPPEPKVIFNTDETERISQLVAALKDYTDSMLISFVTGTASLENDWETYIQECQIKGAQELEEIYNTAYARMK